ncbi:hypothetical protein STENM36S_02312 [Streptomyces tendae]
MASVVRSARTVRRRVRAVGRPYPAVHRPSSCGPGDTLLCVTDGITERRSGSRQFDDGDGLAAALAGCAGLDAELVAERIRRLVHEFGPRPPEDDLALLVLQAE